MWGVYAAFAYALLVNTSPGREKCLRGARMPTGVSACKRLQLSFLRWRSWSCQSAWRGGTAVAGTAGGDCSLSLVASCAIRLPSAPVVCPGVETIRTLEPSICRSLIRVSMLVAALFDENGPFNSGTAAYESVIMRNFFVDRWPEWL